VRGQEKGRLCRAGGGGRRGSLEPRTAIEGSFSAWGGLGKLDHGLGRGETFFPDSDSDRDSDETFQISRKLGLEHVEFFCLLDSQPCFYPSPKTFTDAYKVIEIGLMPNKTRETSFQILNPTIWTNRKAFRSRLADSASCDRCEEEETMEHLLYGCKNYSAVVWREFSTLITATYIAGHPVARMDHTPKEIVYNLHHPSIVLYISDPPSRIILLHLVQEIKRDIIHRRMNITSPRGPIPLLRTTPTSCP
jgi:hypothetical protein